MRKSGYRTALHIYLIFLLVIVGTIITAIGLFSLLITVQKPDGSAARSDWPNIFTEEFREQIVFMDNKPRIKQSGIELLQENGVGVQLLDPLGYEVFSYRKPEQAPDYYSGTDLLQLCQTGGSSNEAITAFVGTVSKGGEKNAYILYFPTKISKVTMYLNGDWFAGGKNIILIITGTLLLVVVISGALYGFLTTKAIKRLTSSIREISRRSYLPVQAHGHSTFHDLYDSLNTLDKEIRAGDRLREQTEKMREEWIANITHDLKTPLSPIKGYAEILQEQDIKNEEKCRRYAGIILKNTSYMEALINDLKLTYQLENGLIPMTRREQDVSRFLKELAIDILNTPEYENRIIRFKYDGEAIYYAFDETLMTRAFRNLIINAFVHGTPDTAVTLRVVSSSTALRITVEDNGNGMRQEEADHLFDRYYRGANTEQKAEGSGLGLAITKSIVELHGGVISAFSVPGRGSSFHIEFSLKVN